MVAVESAALELKRKKKKNLDSSRRIIIIYLFPLEDSKYVTNLARYKLT